MEEDDSRPGSADNCDTVSDEELQFSESFRCTNATRVTEKVCLYNDSNLSMGFIWAVDPSLPIPLCVIFGKQLINAAMAPAKLKSHLTTNQSHLTSKCVYCFKRLLESRNKQSKAFFKKVTFSEKAQ
jgi:hypothetical protein